MTNHPTQGLQDMTLDLSTYSDAGLKELQARIEEEKTKRERKVPFSIDYVEEENGFDLHSLVITANEQDVLENLGHRLSAEAKLRAAGGGTWNDERPYFLYKNIKENIQSTSMMMPNQGVIYFKTREQALAAYATLTPDEQAAIFGFGDSSNEGEW